MNAGRQLRETPAASAGRDRRWKRFLPNIDRTISVQGLIAMIGGVIALFGVFRDFFFSPGVYIPLAQVQLVLADVSCPQTGTKFPFATLFPTVTLVTTAPGRKVIVSVDSADVSIAGQTQTYVITTTQGDVDSTKLATLIGDRARVADAARKAADDAKKLADAKRLEADKAANAAKAAPDDDSKKAALATAYQAAEDATTAANTAKTTADLAAPGAGKERYGLVCPEATTALQTTSSVVRRTPGTLVSIPVDTSTNVAPFLEPQHAGLESDVNAITPAPLLRGAQISMTLRMQIINNGFFASLLRDDRIVLTCHAKLSQTQFDNYLDYNVTSLEPRCALA